jgi:hypothetical protein
MISDGLGVRALGRWARVWATGIGFLILTCVVHADSWLQTGNATEQLATKSAGSLPTTLSERLKSSSVSSAELSSRWQRQREERLREFYFQKDAAIFSEFHVGSRTVEVAVDPFYLNAEAFDEFLVREHVTLESIRQDLAVMADRLADVDDSPIRRIPPADRLGVIVVRAPLTERSGQIELLIPAAADSGPAKMVDQGAGIPLEDFLARLPEHQNRWLVLLDGCWRSSRMPEEAPVPDLAANITLIFGFDTSYPRCEQGWLGVAARQAVDAEKSQSWLKHRHRPELPSIDHASIITSIAERHRASDNRGLWIHAGSGQTLGSWRSVVR